MDQKLSVDQLAYFDRLATLTTERALEDLSRAFATDTGLAVPARVFNAVLQRPERFE